MSLFETLKNAIFSHAGAAGPASSSATAPGGAAAAGAAAASNPATAPGASPAPGSAIRGGASSASAAATQPVNSPDRAGGSQPVTPNEAPARPQNPSRTQSSGANPGSAASTGNPGVDVEAVLNQLNAKSQQKLNWRTSIVDLMKLVGMDSSLQHRKELAAELGYKGDPNDSATLNVWLHKEVMIKLGASGGKIPADLQH